MVTQRKRGCSLNQVVEELNPILHGWFHYFRRANCKRLLRELDAWIRRKLRCYRLKQ
ncbi:group II intron maturase-specific domain-containing protein [Halosquirtibacter xylanolyticus]|uniref:group II intron maturase-specific domain-containing protein n=1 Tax=Halosquirtibacter xylanolyticus TaxID=3374599 RepID=UPI0037484740